MAMPGTRGDLQAKVDKAISESKDHSARGQDQAIAQTTRTWLAARESPEPDTEVFIKAKERSQATFTLVAQDRTAAKTVAFWIMENIATAPGWKLREALDRAIRMRDHRPQKAAD